MKRKTIAVLLIMLLLTGSMFVPSGQPIQTQAAEKAYMKTLSLKWDLKKGKKLTTLQKFAGVGFIKPKIMVKRITTTAASKEGFKKTEVVYTYTAPKLSKKMVHTIYKASRKSDVVGAGFAYAVIDYSSGYSLEGEENELDVSVKKKSIRSKKRYFRDWDGHYVWIENGTEKVTITYPEDYKGLCFGLGGDGTLKSSSINKKFFQGKVKFAKTTYYKTNKKGWHFMRLTK